MSSPDEAASQGLETGNHLEIPWQDLSADALTGVLEEFASRDGTDYGWQEASLASKVEQLREQLKQNRIYLVFDLETETATLKARES